MGEADLLTDVVIIAMYVLTAATLGVTLWSAWHGMRHGRRRQSTRIGWTVAGCVAALLAVTYLTASTRPVVTNGEVFDNAVWLGLTDMFIYSSLTLVVACSVIIVIARFRR